MEDLVRERIVALESKIKNYDSHYNGGIENLLSWQIRLDELKTLINEINKGNK